MTSRENDLLILVLVWAVYNNCKPSDHVFFSSHWSLVLSQGMIALRREATEVIHEDYMDGIMEVNAKKKANLMYYAWRSCFLCKLAGHNSDVSVYFCLN